MCEDVTTKNLVNSYQSLAERHTMLVHHWILAMECTDANRKFLQNMPQASEPVSAAHMEQELDTPPPWGMTDPATPTDILPTPITSCTLTAEVRTHCGRESHRPSYL